MRTSFAPFVAPLLASALALWLGAGCGAGADTSTGGGGSGGGGAGGASGGAAGQGGEAGGGSGGGIAAGCDPACQTGFFCSEAGACIAIGTCAADADCAEGLVCDEVSGVCVPGGGCGGLEATVEAVPPNLLVVLDRSCSMTKQVAGSGMNKWQIAVAALQQMTTSYVGKIRFGLTLFPDKVNPSCQQDAIPYPVGPGNEAAIQAVLTAALSNQDPLYPDGPCVTNIDTAMLQATTDPGFADPDRDSYALLLTDGQQSSDCNAAGGDAGTTQIVSDLLASGVPTFVLGFGDEVDPQSLNAFATAGGVPAMGANAYYDASDQASLDAALAAIANATLSCSFALDMPPANSAEIFVYFDNVQKVPNDPTGVEGWSYDPANNTITFHGMACEALKSGTVSDVDVVFGCDEPTPA
jgi:hypothetical protein